MSTLTKKAMIGALLTSSAITGVAGTAVAQETADADEMRLEEIVVTSRKKQELLTEVPMNIAAVSAVEIQKRNLINKEDVYRTIAGAASPRGSLILRGLSGSNSSAPGTTSTFTDGVPYNFSELYDIERLEVLRGPQGTLYGSNAIGGTVRIITNKPHMNELELFGAVQFKTEKNRPGVEVRGYGGVNVPIMEDKLALRVVGNVSSEDGKIVNTFNASTGKATEHFVRAQLLWQPDSDTSINLSFWNEENYDSTYEFADRSVPGYYYEAELTPNADAPYGYDVAVNTVDCSGERPQCFGGAPNGEPYNPKFAVYQRIDDFDQNTTNLIGLSFDRANLFSGVDLAYAGSFRKHKDFGRQGAWSRFDAGDMFDTWIIDQDEYTRWTHEMRLQSSGENAFDWTVGAFYDEIDYAPTDSLQWQYHASDNRSRAIAAYWWGDDPSVIGQDLYGDDTKNYNSTQREYNQKELAFFGEFGYTFDFGDAGELELTGGLRYYDLHDKVDTETSGIWVGAEPSLTQTDDGESGTRKKVAINYRPNADIAFFGVYAEGYRPGGNNGSLPPHDCLEDENIGSYVDRYNSDKIKNYEVGVKGFALDRRIQFSSAVYQIDWSGVQASVYMPSCGFSYTANAASARSRGFEFESTSLITDSLKLLVNAAYTNSKMLEDVASLGAKAGDNMTMVPKYNFYVALDQEMEFWGREGSIRLDLAGYGEYKSHFNVRDKDISPAYRVVNLSAGVQVTDAAHISVHVNNLLNEDYTLYKRGRYRSDYAQGNRDERYGDERSIAVRLDFKF